MSIIHSMTGSASKLVNSQLANINIDISSVNGRYLEIYLKLPDNLRHLDSKLRALCQEKLTRGKLDCYITYALNAQASLNIDANQLEALSEALNQVEKTIPNACNLNPMEILQYPGILKQPANIQDLIDEQVLENFAKALDSLVKTRESEGKKLKQALQVRLDLIEKQADLIEVQLTNLTKIEREKILKKIEDLKIEIDPQRIEQEVAIIAKTLFFFHVKLNLIKRYVTWTFYHYLDIFLSCSSAKATKLCKLGKLRLIASISQAAWAKTIAKAECDIVFCADIADFIKGFVKGILFMMLYHPRSHERATTAYYYQF